MPPLVPGLWSLKMSGGRPSLFPFRLPRAACAAGAGRVRGARPGRGGALAKRFGLAPRSFDALFLAELDRQIAAARAREELVYETDALGATAEAWPNLVQLARRTSRALAGALLPPGAPLLLTRPGLIDRYGLSDFLHAVVAAARDDAAQAIFLLAPGHEGGAPRIGDTLLPDQLPGQSTWIPKSWIGAQLGAR